MKPAFVLLAAAAALASSGCDGNAGGQSAANTNAPIEAVAPPQGGDWTKMVTQTPQGGFLMGNPNADVKLVEFASMTCPHCAEFDENGTQQLIDKYVKTGRVSFELRNYVRDGLDMSMSLLARCGGPERFFPLTEAMFKNQKEFFERVQGAPAAQQEAAAQSPQGLAQMAGLQQWAAQRGLPSTRSSQCLANQQEAQRLVQMSTDAQTEFPEFAGTPSFVINGKLLENTAGWDTLEPKIRDALGG
jgi:protein-disulfide isomerase